MAFRRSGVRLPSGPPFFEIRIRPRSRFTLDGWGNLQPICCLNSRHLERVLTVWFEHYNQARLHRGLDLRTPIARSDPVVTSGPVTCHERLGGLLREYSRASMPAAAGIRARIQSLSTVSDAGAESLFRSIGFPNIGNGQSIVLTNLCAPQPADRVRRPRGHARPCAGWPAHPLFRPVSKA